MSMYPPLQFQPLLSYPSYPTYAPLFPTRLSSPLLLKALPIFSVHLHSGTISQFSNPESPWEGFLVGGLARLEDGLLLLVHGHGLLFVIVFFSGFGIGIVIMCEL